MSLAVYVLVYQMYVGNTTQIDETLVGPYKTKQECFASAALSNAVQGDGDAERRYTGDTRPTLTRFCRTMTLKAFSNAKGRLHEAQPDITIILEDKNYEGIEQFLRTEDARRYKTRSDRW